MDQLLCRFCAVDIRRWHEMKCARRGRHANVREETKGAHAEERLSMMIHRLHGHRLVDRRQVNHGSASELYARQVTQHMNERAGDKLRQTAIARLVILVSPPSTVHQRVELALSRALDVRRPIPPPRPIVLMLVIVVRVQRHHRRTVVGNRVRGDRREDDGQLLA